MQQIVRVALRLVGCRQYCCKIVCIGCLSVTENIDCCLIAVRIIASIG